MKEYRAEIVKENVPALFGAFCDDEYLRVYNKFANESGDDYKVWNPEYDSLFGKQEDYDTPHYNVWMAKKVQDRIDEINDSKYMYFTVGEVDVDIIGHLIGFPNSKIWVRIFEA